MTWSWRRLLHRDRCAPDPGLPASPWARRLEAAIAAAHPVCLECGNTRLTVEYRADIGEFIPVSHHWAANGPGDSCPVLAGGAAAWQAHEDLWMALEPYLAPYGGLSYGYDETWARRQLAAA